MTLLYILTFAVVSVVAFRFLVTVEPGYNGHPISGHKATPNETLVSRPPIVAKRMRAGGVLGIMYYYESH